jgi:hypothetical protein
MIRRSLAAMTLTALSVSAHAQAPIDQLSWTAMRPQTSIPDPLWTRIAVPGARSAPKTMKTSQGPEQRDITIMALGWLAGCWSLTRSDSVTEEQWMKPAGGTMLGMSRTVRGAKTTEFEFLQIRSVDGKLSYVAKPSGQPEATFPAKTISASEAIFENPSHDFPQRIIYRQTGAGVTARIEGTMNGKERGMDFAFERCR